ncbi:MULTISPECIES: hypothetical protein [Amycolatopsis]|uniref:HTH araC/xylS-type domain-containing protein n=1 Tax=Amycolatopsis bullii TaxID=941987 RepID=A0ABQ3KMQ2_9PSEU|nr:hypothetical protein [Amycolatopsis bullii]GHG38726.1 hypothetical protein GCM10017567_69720 [Amycolatopsis bullii]
MTDLAAGTDNTFAPLMILLLLVVLGGLLAASATMSIIRIARGRQPREQQLYRLAAELDGRDRVRIRMVELGLAEADLRWVAHSRGYGMTEHTFGRYYEFFRAPQQAPPASPGPWQGRP